MGSRPHGPEPCASTNSATAAESDMVAGGGSPALRRPPVPAPAVRALQGVVQAGGMGAGTTTRCQRKLAPPAVRASLSEHPLGRRAVPLHQCAGRRTCSEPRAEDAHEPRLHPALDPPVRAARTSGRSGLPVAVGGSALRRAGVGARLHSTGFMSFGRAGRGRWITIYANARHSYMVTAGRRFDTSAIRETGSRWGPSRSSAGFTVRHPVGL